MTGRDPRPLDDVLIGGRERRPIVICPYDPAWAVRFTEERQKILEALAPAARTVHHVGSTSVEGLAAKPIVDIIVEMDEPDERTFLAPLERVGYELRVREPDHLDAAHARPRRARAHLGRRRRCPSPPRVPRPAPRLARRSSAYAALKMELAQQEWDDMNDYADAKASFIDEIVARA
jgi:GrpB-like predicted nucleotidyltransferase (UPF0157 family)